MVHPLSNIKITNYFNDEPRFNGVFSRNNLPRIKDGAHVTNLDDEKSKVTQWFSLFSDINTAVFVDFFEAEYTPQKALNKIRLIRKLITLNIFRIQDNNSVICGFYCIAFIEYMVVGQTLLDTNLFSTNDYQKNDKIIYKYFKDNYGRRSNSWV